MAFVCGDCVTWITSDVANSYGEKWCDYDQKYRRKDQNIYGCRGFVWARRSIITKVCEILAIDPTKYFQAFDDTKEIYLIPSSIDQLIDYNTVGPVIASSMDNCKEKENLANNMLNGYIIPATELSIQGKHQEAVAIYERMVKVLAVIFNATKEKLEEKSFYNNLIKVR